MTARKCLPIHVATWVAFSNMPSDILASAAALLHAFLAKTTNFAGSLSRLCLVLKFARQRIRTLQKEDPEVFLMHFGELLSRIHKIRSNLMYSMKCSIDRSAGKLQPSNKCEVSQGPLIVCGSAKTWEPEASARSSPVSLGREKPFCRCSSIHTLTSSSSTG